MAKKSVKKVLNQRIIECAGVESTFTATKRGIINIYLGSTERLKPLTDTVLYSPQGNIIVSKKYPNGKRFNPNWSAFVQIGLDLSPLHDGLFDISVVETKRATKLLDNPVITDLNEYMSYEHYSELQPLLICAEEVVPVLLPEETGHNFLLIDDGLIEKIGPDGEDERGMYIFCKENYKSSPSKIYAGDLFHITNMQLFNGYIVDRNDFFKSYYLE